MGMICAEPAANEAQRFNRIESVHLTMLDHRGQPYESPHYRYEPFGRLKPLGLTRKNYLALHKALTPTKWRKSRLRRYWSCAGASAPIALLSMWIVSGLIGYRSNLLLFLLLWPLTCTLFFVVSVYGRWVPPIDPSRFRQAMLRLKHCPKCCYDISCALLDEGERRVCPECGHAWRLPSDRRRKVVNHAAHTTSPSHTTTSTGLPPNS